MPLCLIVARDPVHGATLAAEIERFGLRPYRVEGLGAALAALGQCRFDAVAIDGDGFLATLPQALAELRARLPAPILVLTSCADEERQIAALDCGANEVHLKPSSGRLVAAKLRRLIDLGPPRPAPAPPPREIRLGTLRLDPGRAGASVGAAALPLTAGEFDLLLLLASQAGQFVHRDHIARALHGPGGAANGEPRRSADMHVCRIRRKLREAGAVDIALETVYGRGYLLRLDPAREAAMTIGAAA
jgi:DNA-binding response OmpR family regulator